MFISMIILDSPEPPEAARYPILVTFAPASARDAQRGIAFGSRENGRAHPFVGIGFARGI